MYIFLIKLSSCIAGFIFNDNATLSKMLFQQRRVDKVEFNVNVKFVTQGG